MNSKLNNIDIGNRIRSIREDMFMSREKFSEMVDISEVFLGQIERGESSISLKTLTSIIAYTGVSSDFILFGNNEPDSYHKKIDRILRHCDENTLELLYNLIHDVHKFNRNIKKQQ